MTDKKDVKSSVIRPGDIPVKAEKYKTYLSPVVSSLAILIFEEGQKNGGLTREKAD